MMNDACWPLLADPASAIGIPAGPSQPENAGKLRRPPPPAKPHSRIRLSSVSDVAAQLRVIYREARAGKLATSEATKFAYLLNLLAGILSASDLEARLAALEDEKVR